jgi:hypothetical protein
LDWRGWICGGIEDDDAAFIILGSIVDFNLREVDADGGGAIGVGQGGCDRG